MEQKISYPNHTPLPVRPQKPNHPRKSRCTISHKKAQFCTISTNFAQFLHNCQRVPFSESNVPQPQKDGFLHFLHKCKNKLCTQKIPYPKPSARQVLNIPIDADQSRSMAKRLPKNCFNPKQTATNPKPRFSPLFNNAKNH
jgi:hypothetical protein